MYNHGYYLSAKSLKNMEGVHNALIRVVKRAIQITDYDFRITNLSVRTSDQQHELIKNGASKTMNSRHVIENNQCGKSCAIDFIAFDRSGRYTKDIGYYRKINQAFVTAAIEEGVQIELGALWKNFVDGGHVQLPWGKYP